MKKKFITMLSICLASAFAFAGCGGDFAIMHDLIAYLNGDESSVSITKLEDSINGHLCVFAAEKSRKENVIVSI